jgi:hypothetical protein
MVIVFCSSLTFKEKKMEELIDISYLLAGWYLVLPLSIFIPMLVAGFIFANKLQNTPYRLNEKGEAVPGPSGLFTSLPPGIVKIIVRGDTPLYFLMDYLNHLFQKDNPNIKSPTSEQMHRPEDEFNVVTGGVSTISDIIPFPKIFTGITMITDFLFIQIRILWWIWKVLIYKWSGVIFTGIPEWQTVRTYKLEYLKLKDGHLVNKSTYSDQFRVMKFDIYVQVPSVETRDNVKLEVIIHLVCRVRNPWLTAFGVPQSEGWYNRVSGVLSSVVRDYYKSTTYPKTLEKEDTLKLTVALMALGKYSDDTAAVDRVKVDNVMNTGLGTPIADIGMEVISAAIYNQSVADPELMKALGATAIATANATARKTEADAEAYANEKISSTMKDDKNAQTVYEKEATIRTVQAAPKGSIVTIDTTKGHGDTLLKAILSELKNKNEDGEK